MIKVKNFDTLEKNILKSIYEIDKSIEEHKEQELYENIPHLEYKRKKQIEFYTETFLKYNTTACKKANELIIQATEDIKRRESAYQTGFN